MSLFTVFLGLDKAADGLLTPARDVADDTDDLTISAVLGALVAWPGTPAPTRQRALWWHNRVEGFFALLAGQHCHCADAALGYLDQFHPDVSAAIEAPLQARIDAAQALNLRTTI